MRVCWRRGSEGGWISALVEESSRLQTLSRNWNCSLMDVEKLLYLLLGWILGLIGPFIGDALKASRRKREVAEAIRIELEELRYRMAAASLMMITKQGRLDKKFLNWVLPVFQNYGGNEPT